MKKVFSLLLASIMLLSCFMLASCGNDGKVTTNSQSSQNNVPAGDAITEEDIQNNPFKVIYTALNSTNLKTPLSGLNSAASEAMKAGSVTVHFQLEDTQFDIALYGDEKNNRFVTSIKGTSGEQKVDVTAEISLDKIAVKMGDYGFFIDIAKFNSEFKKSNLYKTIISAEGSTPEEIAELEKQIDAALKALNIQKVTAVTPEIFTKKANIYLGMMEKKYSFKDVDVNGKSTKCLNLTYSFSKESVMKILNKFIDEELFSGGTEEEMSMSAQLKLMLVELVADVEFDGSIETNISVKDGKILNGNIKVNAMGTEVKASVELTSNGFNATASATSGSAEIFKATAKYELTEDEKGTKALFEMKAETEDSEIYHMVLSGNYDKASGKFELSVKVNPDTSNDMLSEMLILKGTFKVSNSEALFSVDQIQIQESDSLNNVFSIKIKMNDTAPEITGLKNVLDMSVEELQAIIEAISGSVM